jgi:hypothetical protein
VRFSWRLLLELCATETSAPGHSSSRSEHSLCIDSSWNCFTGTDGLGVTILEVSEENGDNTLEFTLFEGMFDEDEVSRFSLFSLSYGDVPNSSYCEDKPGSS